jgi:Trk-type K+ transport system membrane component
MLKVAILNISIVVAVVVIHAVGTTMWVEGLRKHLFRPERKISYLKALQVIISTVLFILFLHTAEVFIWAVVYYVLPDMDVFIRFEESLYFSFTTFTTLGCGDITLPAPWHHMTGVQALSGILLAGWSSALFFVVFHKLWNMVKLEKKE